MIGMSTWYPLEPGEPIGVVALSGPVDRTRLSTGLESLASWGHPLLEAANLTRREGYLAGSDDARLEGLLDLLDRGVRFFVAARGGYGAARLLDRLPWAEMAEDRVRVVGFSDLTAVLNPLAATVTQIHGPMVAAGLSRPENAERLRRLVEDGDPEGRRLFRIPPRSVLRHGKTSASVVGGNLTLLSSLIGTPWEPDFNGKALFVEEVSEPPYRLDRLLTHLRSSASFSGVKALICGALHACRPHGECVSRFSELLLEAAPDGVPVVLGLPFGHGAINHAFPIGARVDIDTRRGAVFWSV